MKILFLTLMMSFLSHSAFGAEVGTAAGNPHKKQRTEGGGAEAKSDGGAEGIVYEPLSLEQLSIRSFSLGFKEALGSSNKGAFVDFIRNIKQALDSSKFPEYITLNLIQLLLDGLQEAVTTLPYNIQNRDAIQKKILDLFLESIFDERSTITYDNSLINSLLDFFSLKITGENYKYLIQWLESQRHLSSILQNISASLYTAVKHGHTAIVNFLLARGADANHEQHEESYYSNHVLVIAAMNGHTAIVNALLDAGANVNHEEEWNSDTTLMYAAHDGHTATVNVLIERGADVNHATNDGWTALMFAAREGQTETVQAILPYINEIDQLNQALEEADNDEIRQAIQTRIDGIPQG